MADDTPYVPFAERLGFREPRTIFQIDHLDSDTRVALWNTLHHTVVEGPLRADEKERMAAILWTRLFKRARDSLRYSGDSWRTLRTRILEGDWVDCLGALETVVRVSARMEYFDDYALSGNEFQQVLIDFLNEDLEEHLVGYRFIDCVLAPITSEAEIEALEDAIEATADLPGAQYHLKKAIEHLSDRNNPDYANSAKESLSAAESLMETITSKTTLGDALKNLPKGIEIHRAQIGAWQKMYGWASDEDGIRHSAQEMPTVDQAMAKYTLVTCSAFVNLMITEANKAGLLTSGGTEGT